MGIILKNSKNLNNLEGFLHRKEINSNHFDIAYIALGQAGGKIASDISKFGYYGVYINTCNQDLLDIKNVLKSIYRENINNYKIIKLKGYDGASKDRNIGLKAIKDNKELIKNELLTDEKLKQADFVWIICSLGGGTGCGAVSAISQITSNIIRKDKRIMIKKDKDGKIINQGKATVGIIAAIPDNNSSPKMKLNTAEALEEIKILHDNKLIGSVLLVDNEKIITDYLENPSSRYDWTVFGNTTVASSIIELALLTGLPGVETFDKSEIIDIWSTPGFLSIGKNKLNKDWVIDHNNIVNNDKTNIEDKINTIVDESFKNSSVFANGYDFLYTIHGGLAIITKNNNIINSKHSILLYRALNRTLHTPEVIHYGIFNNDIFGTYKKPKYNTDEAIIYTLAIVKKLPKRIFEMTEKALTEKQENLKRIKSSVSSLTDYLNINKNLDHNNNININDFNNQNLDNILDNNVLENTSTDDYIDEFDKLFN